MATKHLYLQDLHFDHQVWKNELQFYKQEIALLEKRLGEISSRYTNQEVLAQLEHFQNQYIRQREVLDELMHDINTAEHQLVRFTQTHETAIDHHYFDEYAPAHDKLKQRSQVYAKIYAELKAELHTFLSKWM